MLRRRRLPRQLRRQKLQNRLLLKGGLLLRELLPVRYVRRRLSKVGRRLRIAIQRLRIAVQRVRERNGIGGRLKTLLAEASLGIAEASLGIAEVTLGIAEVTLRIKVTLRIEHIGLCLEWMK